MPLPERVRFRVAAGKFPAGFSQYVIRVASRSSVGGRADIAESMLRIGLPEVVSRGGGVVPEHLLAFPQRQLLVHALHFHLGAHGEHLEQVLMEFGLVDGIARQQRHEADRLSTGVVQGCAGISLDTGIDQRLVVGEFVPDVFAEDTDFSSDHVLAGGDVEPVAEIVAKLAVAPHGDRVDEGAG